MISTYEGVVFTIKTEKSQPNLSFAPTALKSLRQGRLFFTISLLTHFFQACLQCIPTMDAPKKVSTLM
jgi:hypothetical protein